jgi:mono/diheme cytochrome c family protein
MYDQPRYKPLGKSDFFADDRQARPLVEGTVARGTLREDSRLYTGKTGNAALVTVYPLPVTRERIERGHQRYDIYCAPCHDRTGSGNGMVVQRGYRPPPSFHIDRLRQVAIGHFYDVITNGFGAMPDYAAQIPPEDRWAIVAYVRALQLSQNAALADVPPDRRADLDKPAPALVDSNSPQFPSLYRSLPNPKPPESDRPGTSGKTEPGGSK